MSDKQPKSPKKPPQQMPPPPKKAKPSEGESTSKAAESTKARIEERKHEREKERQRTRTLTIVGVSVTVALLALLLLFVRNSPADAPVDENLSARYEGIEQGADNNGFPRLGKPTARINVEEFSSFECSACKIFHDDIFPSLLERVRAGEITFSFIPIAIGASNPEGAIRAALCAYDQNKFWETHDTFFTWQGLYGNNAFTQNRMLAGAEKLGFTLDSACISSDRVNNLINRAREFGIRSTPTIRVNGTTVNATLSDINAAIDNLLASQAPSTPIEATPTTLPNQSEATAEVTAQAQVPEATMEATEVSVEVTTEATEVVTEAPATNTPRPTSTPRPTLAPSNTPEPTQVPATNTPRPTRVRPTATSEATAESTNAP